MIPILERIIDKKNVEEFNKSHLSLLKEEFSTLQKAYKDCKNKLSKIKVESNDKIS